MENKELLALSAKLVENNIERICQYICGIGKNSWNKFKIECGEAFRSYLMFLASKKCSIPEVQKCSTPVYTFSN